MASDQPKGYEAVLQLRADEAVAAAARAQQISIIALVVAALAVVAAVFAISRAKGQTGDAREQVVALERQIDADRKTLDALRDHTNESFKVLSEKMADVNFTVKTLKVTDGVYSMTITPTMMMAQKLRADAGPEVLWALSTEPGKSGMLFGDHKKQRMMLDAELPSIQIFDDLGRLRAGLGVVSTVVKADGTKTISAPSNLTFFDKEGDVTLSLPRP